VICEVPTLVGRRCTLRALRPGDAPALQRHADDPAVAFNLFDAWPQPYTLEAAQAWCTDGHREPAMGHVWGIEVPIEGPDAGAAGREIAGCISVAPESGIYACSAVLGYWLGQAHWRRGITSEALAMVTAWTWSALPGITRLWMPIYARNAGSQAVARKAGYTLEGRMPLAVRKDGRAIDAVGYGCIRPGLAPGEAALPTLTP
jgi:RimJ/RimL family protein N-acetyltransferase